MKILVTIPCLLTGGTEIQTLNLVRALVEGGHEVTTACYFEHSPYMVGRYEEAGSRVVLFSPEGRRQGGVKCIAFLWRNLRRVRRTVRPDAVHVQYMAPGALPILLLRLMGQRNILATAHTAADIYSPRGLQLLQWLQRHVLRAFTCITERAEKSFFGSSTLFGPDTTLAKRGNHFTIYNNLPGYIHRAEQARRQHKPLTIGVVSRLEGIKGMDLVIPAFAEVHRQEPGTQMLVVGDGSMRPLMERQAREADVADCVTFVGRQEQERLQDYYDRIDILLMPSRSEGFGLTAIEGMARGCVLVASNIGGLPEVVIDGETGLLHRSEDVSDMAEKILLLLRQPQMREKMSEAAVRRTALFGSDSYGQLITSLYEKIEH